MKGSIEMEAKINLIDQDAALVNMAAEDCNLIPVRPLLVKHFGSMNTAAFLTRAMYLFQRSNGEPFYKFTTPCGHELYQEGDSWMEEVGLSAKSLKTVLRKIGFKQGTTSWKAVATEIAKTTGKPATVEETRREINRRKSEALIVYYTDRDRVTWYELNMKQIAEILTDIYGAKEEERA